MAVWFRAGDDEIGVEDGIVRAADFASLVEVCELAGRAADCLAAAEKKAAAIIDATAERVSGMVADARKEGERLKSEAHALGLSEAANQWAEEMSRKAIEAHISVQRASDRLAELVSLAAQRVIEVEDKEGLYRRALRTVSHMTKESKTLVLHIGAADAEGVRATVAGIAAEVGIEVPVEIKIDHRLGAGGCVLESDFGVIDASLGLQLSAVKQAISNAARSALKLSGREERPPLAGGAADGL